MQIDLTQIPFLRAKSDNFTNMQQTKAVIKPKWMFEISARVLPFKTSFGKTFGVEKGLKV